MIDVRILEYNVVILNSVQRALETFKQNRKSDNESGGILLGQIKDKNIYVMRASIPNKFDSSSRFSFERDKEIAQIITNHEFINSERKSIYLGEWHTHPENDPSPSPRDIQMIKDQFRKSKTNEPFLLLLIQGKKELYIGLFDGDRLSSR